MQVEERGNRGTWYCYVFNLNIDPLFREEGKSEGKKGEGRFGKC